MENNSILHQLGLALVTGVGTTLARNLIRHTGSVTAIFEEKSGNLLKIPGIGKKIADNLRQSDIMRRAEQEVQFMEKNHINMVFFEQPEYPSQLRQCPDAPVVLFYKGILPKRMERSISIIGTRNPSQRGRLLTSTWIKELARCIPDLFVISGLAYGIDISAHEAALSNNLPTLAVLGHGFHTIYPSLHRHTAERIEKEGALITDFFSYNKIEPKNFIRRNRIIAGLTDSTLVVESSLKGGAMATAEMANSYNREVLAVPGRPTDLKSLGCNYLIRSNQAALVNTPSDISFLMGWDDPQNKNIGPSKSTQDLNLLSDFQRNLLNLLRKDELNINELGMLLQTHPARLTGDLLSLEFGGLILAAPGGRYKAL